MGADCKLNENTQDLICDAIKEGNTYENAAQLAGICEKTLYNWIQRGKDGEDGFLQFLQALKKANAKAEQKMVSVIVASAPRNWQAAAWFLERRNPQHWGNKTEQKVEHSGTIQHVKFTFDTTEQPQSTTSAPTKTKGDAQTTQQP